MFTEFIPSFHIKPDKSIFQIGHFRVLTAEINEILKYTDFNNKDFNIKITFTTQNSASSVKSAVEGASAVSKGPNHPSGPPNFSPESVGADKNTGWSSISGPTYQFEFRERLHALWQTRRIIDMLRAQIGF